MCELILKDSHILPGCRHTCVHTHTLAALSQPDRQTQPFCRLLGLDTTFMHCLLPFGPALSSSEPDSINCFFPYLLIFPRKLPQALALYPAT